VIENYRNPFPEGDPDRHAIWEILMRRDFNAFLSCDWSKTGGDFLEDGFFGIDARKKTNPEQWQVITLTAYRESWQKEAENFKNIELDGESKLDFLFRSVHLRDIDICEDRAIAWKKFDGHTRTVTGQPVEINWQSLYKMIRTSQGWKIAGFVGYMPYPMPGVGRDMEADRSIIEIPPAVGSSEWGFPFSPAATAKQSTTLIALSGQGPLNPDGSICGDTITEQTRTTLDNCREKLKALDASFHDVLKVNVYLRDVSMIKEFNKVYLNYFDKPYPARTTIGATPPADILVEIEMWAAIRK